MFNVGVAIDEMVINLLLHAQYFLPPSQKKYKDDDGIICKLIKERNKTISR